MAPSVSYFAAKLLSPRPTFPYDMTEQEGLIMQQHTAFWQDLFAQGIGRVTGPIFDPKGAYGFGIIAAASLEEAEALLRKDPAVAIGTYEVYPMLASFASSQ